MPAFSFRHIKDLHPVFLEKSIEMVDTIEQQINDTGSSHIEVNSWANRATLDIIGVAGSKSADEDKATRL